MATVSSLTTQARIFFIRTAAFVKRDFLIESSYRASFILIWLLALIELVIFYFISKLMEGRPPLFLSQYSDSYFPFVSVGIVISLYLKVGAISFAKNLNNEIMMGTLNSLFMSPTDPYTVMMSMCFWRFLFNSLPVLLYLFIGIHFFHLHLTGLDFFAVFLILLLTVLYFSFLGIISASFILIVKRGDSVFWAINLLHMLFGGVFFPISVLPEGWRLISYLLPITYSLTSLRMLLLKDYGIGDILHAITMLVFFCCITFLMSRVSLRLAVKRVKLEGSLTHY